jgi:non-ribosomal peptide synthetase component F
MDSPNNLCLHHLFERRVQFRPDAVAAIFRGTQLTYRELNSRANNWGHYLRTLGVGPDVAVGVYMERSLETLVGMLAVFKAGGACLYLDPTEPSERLAFMLEDTQAPLVLTQERLRGTSQFQSARIVCMDAKEDVTAQYPDDNPVSDVGSHNLAYILFTSGSTGKPKFPCAA